MKLKYYRIRRSSEPKIVGVKDGAQVVISDKGFKDKDGFARLLQQFSLANFKSGKSMHPDFEVSIEYAKAYKTAKLTDFLYFTPNLWGCPFMLSAKAISIFAEYNIVEHNLYPVALFQRDLAVAGYKLFQCKELDYDVIDFPASIFRTGYDLLNNIKYYTFNTMDEFSDHKGLPFFEAEKLTLINNFDTRLDFFILRKGGMFVSERLSKRIAEEGLKGIYFDNFNATT